MENKNKQTKQKEKGLDYPVSQVRKWHRKFGLPVAKKPQQLDKEQAFNRMSWTTEEVVEFLYGTVGGNKEEFVAMVDRLIQSVKDTRDKIIKKSPVVDDILIAQIDAGIDIEYFQKGTWVEMGVYPQEMFNIVQAANMGKIFPDGSVRRNSTDGKVIKPDNWERDFAPEPKLKKAIKGQIRRAEQRNGK